MVITVPAFLTQEEVGIGDASAPVTRHNFQRQNDFTLITPFSS